MTKYNIFLISHNIANSKSDHPLSCFKSHQTRITLKFIFTEKVLYVLPHDWLSKCPSHHLFVRPFLHPSVWPSSQAHSHLWELYVFFSLPGTPFLPNLHVACFFHVWTGQPSNYHFLQARSLHFLAQWSWLLVYVWLHLLDDKPCAEREILSVLFTVESPLPSTVPTTWELGYKYLLTRLHGWI